MVKPKHPLIHPIPIMTVLIETIPIVLRAESVHARYA